MSDELIRMKWAVGILSTIMHDGSGVGSAPTGCGYGVEYAGGLSMVGGCAGTTMLEPRRAWVDDSGTDLLQGRRDVLLKLLWLSKKLIDSKNTL